MNWVCLYNRFEKRKHLISGKIIFKAVSLTRAWSHVFIYIGIFIQAPKNPSLQRLHTVSKKWIENSIVNIDTYIFYPIEFNHA